MLAALRLVIWRVWKWFLHYLTGNCEIYRICLSNLPLTNKIGAVVQCLQLSRIKALNNIEKELGVELNATAAAELIVKEKCIKPYLQHEFRDRLVPCLSKIGGVKKLWKAVEEIRSQAFDQTNDAHEEILMKLWNNLMPSTELTARIGGQWQEIGFQGNNPATDFRGMGLLGLHCLVYFSEEYQDKARALLLHSKHPQYWYPFAVVGIDLTGEMYSLLKEGVLHTYFYSKCTQWPPPTTYFMETFCYVFTKFDSFWRAEKPDDIMSFPKVKAKFLEQLTSDITAGNIVMSLHTHTD